MSRLSFVFVAAALVVAPATAAGQVAWEAPFRMGPGQVGGLGIHLVDSEPGPGFGGMVTWRGRAVPGGIGLRLGVAEGFRDEVAVFGGIDFSGYLAPASDDFPVDVSWAAGLGASVSEYVLFSAPLGLYVGRTFAGDGVRFVPHVGPRISFDGHMGRKDERGINDEAFELDFSLDLGGDVVLGDGIAIRFGASVFDHEALSIGVVFPGVTIPGGF